MLGAEDRLLSYPWSSFTWYLAALAHRPAGLQVDRLLGKHGLAGDTAEARQKFERRMETRRAQETDDAEWEPLRRGWCLGGAGFRQELLDRIAGQLGEHHAGELRREAAEAKAERITTEALPRSGLDGSGSETKEQERPGETGTGGPVAPGNDVDDQRDRPAAACVAIAAFPHPLSARCPVAFQCFRFQRFSVSWQSATTRLHSLKRKEEHGTKALL